MPVPELLNTPEDATDDNERTELIYTLLPIRYVTEPRTYRDAINSAHAEQWLLAACSEMKSHEDNATWILVPPPKGRKVLRNRWVWVVKYYGDGEVDRFKARLVIKGFLQQHDINYNEIFAPVLRMEVLRLLLTIAALLDFEVHQMDVKTAFLNGFLDEKIYMEQPEGFAVPGKEHLVCKLQKSLYGLNQAPRVWYQTITAFLASIGFRRLIKDRCAFVGSLQSKTCNIAVYVDDLLIIAPTSTLVNEIKSAMKQRFHMTDVGEVTYLLGWSVERDRKSRKIFIQEMYATKILDRFNHIVTYPVTTPVDRSVKLSNVMCPTTDSEKDTMKSIPYREAVGSFMYLTIGTRPDLAYYMREVSQFLSNPGEEHWMQSFVD
jgi:hypothetical protein